MRIALDYYFYMYGVRHIPNVDMDSRIPDYIFKALIITKFYLSIPLLMFLKIQVIITILLNIKLNGQGVILSFLGQYIFVGKQAHKKSSHNLGITCYQNPIF